MTVFDPKESSDWVDPDHSGHTDDAWHAHPGEAPPQHSHGTVTPAAIMAVGLIGFLLVVACVVVITQYFTMESQRELASKQEVSIGAEYRSLAATWDQNLREFGWADAEAGTIRIPIEAAADKVAREYAGQR